VSVTFSLRHASITALKQTHHKLFLKTPPVKTTIPMKSPSDHISDCPSSGPLVNPDQVSGCSDARHKGAHSLAWVRSFFAATCPRKTPQGMIRQGRMTRQARMDTPLELPSKWSVGDGGCGKELSGPLNALAYCLAEGSSRRDRTTVKCGRNEQ
jgi:hypothetical protein